MIKISSLLLLFLSVHFLHAQTLRRPVAAAVTGSGAYSNTHSDVFSFTANQAALARFQTSAIGIYGEKRFLLSELSLYNLAFILPTHSGNFGFKAGYYGFNRYNETQASLAYGRSLGDKVDVGVQFNYNAIKIAGYGNVTAISFEAGVILHLTDKLNAGVHINNPVGGKYNKGDDEKLPFVYTVGLGYEASNKFFVSAEIQKEEDQPVNINAGLQYKFLPQLIARGGVATATSSYWLGLGTLVKELRIDATASYHPQLGITPGLMLSYNFKTMPLKEEK
jgi:hypothetical protein